MRCSVFSIVLLAALTITNQVYAGIINVPVDQPTIQAAIDIANPGDQILIASGTYDEAINVDGKVDIEFSAVVPTEAIIKPSTANAWDVGGYGSSRWAGVRLVNSTGISMSGLSFDFDLIKANTVTGVLVWDSEVDFGSVNFANMSASDAGGQYTEIMTYVRAPGGIIGERAAISFINCTFTETGRIGIVAHDYVHITAIGCHFEKTIPDFGYAIEIGSEATALIEDCVITGFNTPAASDGSISAGVLIENSFTAGESSYDKIVELNRNFIYNNQWGLYIGNGHDGLAGEVPIEVTLTENVLFGNIEGGIVVTDEDAEAGSSVMVESHNNDLVGNSNGYYIFSKGDGDLTVSIFGDTLEGHENGLVLYDNTPGSLSKYEIGLTGCYIFDNYGHGVINVHDVSWIYAKYNYWGDDSGPSGEGPGSGDAVSGRIEFFPWTGGPEPCCGEFMIWRSGNVDSDVEGKINLADITLLIDRVYISKTPLECEAEGNTDGDLAGVLNLADITRLIDAVYISKENPAPCLPYTVMDLGEREPDKQPVSVDRGLYKPTGEVSVFR